MKHLCVCMHKHLQRYICLVSFVRCIIFIFLTHHILRISYCNTKIILHVKMIWDLLSAAYDANVLTCYVLQNCYLIAKVFIVDTLYHNKNTDFLLFVGKLEYSWVSSKCSHVIDYFFWYKFLIVKLMNVFIMHSVNRKLVSWPEHLICLESTAGEWVRVLYMCRRLCY